MAKATKQQLKQHNTTLILKTVYAQGEMSRADLARKTKLTRPTVSSIINDLIASNLVLETGIGQSIGGKRPILLAVNSSDHHLLCIDISGSKFRGALLNLRGEIVHRAESTIEDLKGEALIDIIYGVIDDLLLLDEMSIIGIAVGTPGLFDPHTGIVRRSVNLAWENMPLQERLETRYDYPIHIVNDSQAAALGELHFGQKQDSNNLVLIKAGRGIGAGIIVNSEILWGDGYGTGEIGQVVMSSGKRGKLLTLESVASTPIVLKQIQDVVRQHIEWDDVEPFRNEEIDQIIVQAGHYLGVAIANLTAILSIHNVVVSGRLTQFDDLFLDAIKKAAQTHGFKDTIDETLIRYSKLGDDIVLLGCSALVLKNELGLF